MSLFRTLRFRLTLWYLVILAATLAVFSGGVYLAMRESLYSGLDDSLDSRAQLAASIVVQEGELSVTGVQLPSASENAEEIVRVFDTSGELLDANFEGDSSPVDADAVAKAISGQTTHREATARGEDLRIRTGPIRANGEVVGAVEVSLSRGDAQEALASLLWIIAIAYPAALLITTAGGAFLASRALGPIDRVTRIARRITAEDLSQRLDLHLPDDEVGRLASTLDDMIARLDEAFRRQRQFTADASHELRTPLTAIKGQTEVALNRERSPEEYRQILSAVNIEADRMIRLVGSLLTLARADASRIPIQREEVDASQIVTDVLDQVRVAAEAKGLSVTLEPGPEITISADQDLLLQLVLNLLDNAVKYTPSGGAIAAGWRRTGGFAEIHIRDNGPGISSQHLPHIFDRFYRVDPARSRAEGGAGLGLSICRWIAEAHGGSLVAQSAEGSGTTFVVRLPLA